MGVFVPSSISINISSSLLKNKNPKKTITVLSGSSNGDDCTVATSSSSASTDVAFEEEPGLIAVENSSDSNSIAVVENAVQKASIENKNSSYKRRRSLVRVRFTPGTTTDPELITKQKNKHKKKRKSPSESPPESSATADRNCDCESVLWWTKKELKDIQLSCVCAVKSCEYGFTPTMPTSNNDCDVVATETATTDLTAVSSLDRFLSRNRKRRKVVRWQMYETVKAVRDFESATKTKAPEEMLPQLLHAYSKPMEHEAVDSALQLQLQLHTAATASIA